MAKKKNAAARYAFIALIVALLGCVAAGLLALVQGAIKLQLYTPIKPETVKLALSISAAVMVLGLATYAIIVPDKVRRFLAGRQARYGSNAVIMTIAFVGILFVVNMLAFQNPKSLDLTEGKEHTLAPETLQALASLPDKVTAIAFYSNQLSSDSANQLLSDFKVNSKGKFDYRFVNPETDPIAARQAGITGDGKIMLTMSNHKEIASYASETELTRALIRLISPEARTVYFLTGHGEPGIESGGDVSTSVARSTLENKNYTVKSLNLAAEGKIPEDALAIIIAGPKKPLLDQEIPPLKRYVDKGGSLVVMEDPPQFTDFGDAADPLADYLASDWGITLDKDVIIDLSNAQQPLQAVSATYNPHPITQNLTNSLIVILPRARSISLTSQPKDVTQTALIQTSQQSWGETNFTTAQGDKIGFDQGADILGPLNMGVAAENTTTKGRVVVFGNSLFATDQAFDAYGNGSIFINSVDWAAEQENLINITPRTSTPRSFNPPSQLQWIAILLGSVFIIPGLVVVAGISSWLSRRRRG